MAAGLVSEALNPPNQIKWSFEMAEQTLPETLAFKPKPMMVDSDTFHVVDLDGFRANVTLAINENAEPRFLAQLLAARLQRMNNIGRILACSKGDIEIDASEIAEILWPFGQECASIADALITGLEKAAKESKQ